MLPMLGVLSAQGHCGCLKADCTKQEAMSKLAVWQANISTADLAVLYVTLMSD